MKPLAGIFAAFLWTFGGPALTATELPLTPVPWAAVQLRDAFWGPRLETNRTVTVGHNLRELERQGSLGGFALLAGRTTDKYHGYMWGDSDVYKTLEGMAYSLRAHPDAALEKRLNEIVADIAGAQAADGYLMPHLQLAEPQYRHFSDETTRTCELYSMGHLLEAAVAHYETTGRRELLDVAIKLADLIVREYGPGRIEKPSGHPQIEWALTRLYRATNRREYLDLAAALVDRARREATLWSNGRPALGHDEAWGHAVAMFYLYRGATEVAALTGDRALLELMQRKWDSVTQRKLYLTGGVGHPRHHEGFADDYCLAEPGSVRRNLRGPGQRPVESSPVPGPRRRTLRRCAGACPVQRVPVRRRAERRPVLLCQSAGNRRRPPAVAVVRLPLLPDERGSLPPGTRAVPVRRWASGRST